MTDRDPVLAPAIRSLPVPEHGPGFWEALEAELAGETYGSTPGPRARNAARVGVLAAAAVVALALVGLSKLDAPRSDSASVDIQRGPTTTTHAGSTYTTSVAPASTLAAATVVEQFVDAAEAGDLGAVADLVGPRSKAYAAATGTSLTELLRDAVPAGLGPDATTQVFDGPTAETRVVAVRDGDTVMAAPVWHDPATDRWFVEPWALDPATGDRITFRSPDAMAAGDMVRVDTPVDGEVRIAASEGLSVLVPTSRRQAGTLPPPDVREQVVIAAMDTGTMLSATAQLLFVDPEPGSPQGAGVLFMYRWWLGDWERMARYGTADAVAQAKAIPSNNSRYDRFTCEGTAGSTYCTWNLADDRRFVLRVADLERPLRVVEFRLDDR